MARNYKEVPHWWYIVVLVLSFVLGLVVVITQKITLPVWGYVIALLLGIFIAPLVSHLCLSADSLQLFPIQKNGSLLMPSV